MFLPSIVGAVDGTELVWSSDVGGSATLDRGDVVDFRTGAPFVVRGQDASHPFLLFTYMTGSQSGIPGMSGYGDPDFVLNVAPQQYLRRYVFFADPTYPETNLVVVRTRDDDGMFHDVVLDCHGALGGWLPLGDYEWTRVDLTTGDFEQVGGCTTGRREIHSAAPFGVTVWG